MFKEWLHKKDKPLAENLWGNIPCKTRKPSDGWGTKPAGDMSAATAPKMMKKMKKK